MSRVLRLLCDGVVYGVYIYLKKISARFHPALI